MPLQKDIEKRCLFPFHVVSIEARHPELHVRVRSQAVCVPKWWSLDASPIRAEFGARTASPLCLLCRTVSRTVSHLLRGVFCPDRGGRRTAIMARSVPPRLGLEEVAQQAFAFHLQQPRRGHRIPVHEVGGKYPGFLWHMLGLWPIPGHMMPLFCVVDCHWWQRSRGVMKV